MNRQHAQEFIVAFNDLAKYCPPILLERCASTPVMQAILQVANGQIELTPKAPTLVRPEEQEGRAQ